jgi:hypothetical protein
MRTREIPDKGSPEFRPPFGKFLPFLKSKRPTTKWFMLGVKK